MQDRPGPDRPSRRHRLPSVTTLPTMNARRGRLACLDSSTPLCLSHAVPHRTRSLAVAARRSPAPPQGDPVVADPAGPAHHRARLRAAGHRLSAVRRRWSRPRCWSSRSGSSCCAGLLPGFVIGRLFIIGHDGCHQSLTPHRRRSTRWLGRIAFLPSLTAYSLWDMGHNACHDGFTNLKGVDFVWAPLTQAEYRALSPVGQLVPAPLPQRLGPRGPTTWSRSGGRK